MIRLTTTICLGVKAQVYYDTRYQIGISTNAGFETGLAGQVV